MFFKTLESLASVVALIGGGAVLALYILEQQIGLHIPLVDYDLNYAGGVAVMAVIMTLITRFAAWMCGR